jgi:diaminopimelate epimerase
MTGPAEAVFDGVVAPSLLEPGFADTPEALPAEPAVAADLMGAAAVPPAIDCATACVNGCLRPEACVSADARARVTALLENRSLDDLLALASQSLESRTLGRASGHEPTVP